MSHGPANPAPPARRRPRRFISQFAELEILREPGAGGRGRPWLWVALLVVVAGLVLALYDLLSG